MIKHWSHSESLFLIITELNPKGENNPFNIPASWKISLHFQCLEELLVPGYYPSGPDGIDYKAAPRG